MFHANPLAELGKEQTRIPGSWRPVRTGGLLLKTLGTQGVYSKVLHLSPPSLYMTNNTYAL